jgi:phage shock protein PspC (stress-responsive transcriptional regulator)
MGPVVSIQAGVILLLVVPVILMVLLIWKLNAPKTDGPSESGISPTRMERTSLLRERRDRYQQERTRIIGMVDAGQISAAEAARLLDRVERETTTMACPFCQEDIRVEALTCHHCGNQLVEEDRQPRRFIRSDNRMLAGVCVGIAEYTGMDVILVVLATLSTGIVYGLLIYLVAALVMPKA